MPFLTRNRAVWLLLNLALAVLVPVAFAWWLNRQVALSDATFPEGFTVEKFILAFTASWAAFLLLLNVTMALFLWLKRR